jgi:hypothetical protein
MGLLVGKEKEKDNGSYDSHFASLSISPPLHHFIVSFTAFLLPLPLFSVIDGSYQNTT